MCDINRFCVWGGGGGGGEEGEEEREFCPNVIIPFIQFHTQY